MKKYLFYILIVSSVIFEVKSQVGINTQSPTGIFHIKPSEISTKNIVFSSDGYLGVDTNTPTSRLHINKNGTENFLQIKDGTENVDRIFISDANGYGSWASTKGSGGSITTYSNPLTITTTGGYLPIYDNNTVYEITQTGTYLLTITFSGSTTYNTRHTTSIYFNLMYQAVNTTSYTLIDMVEYYTPLFTSESVNIVTALIGDNLKKGSKLQIRSLVPAGTFTTNNNVPYRVTIFLL